MTATVQARLTMKLLNFTGFEAAVARIPWARIAGGRLGIAPPGVCYETTFELGGIVGADMSDCLLNEFMRNRVDSGFLQVVRGCDNSPAQGIVVDYLLCLQVHRDPVEPHS